MFLPSTNNQQWLSIKIRFLIQFDTFANAQIVPATAWGVVNTPPWPSVKWSWGTPPGKDDIGKLKPLYFCEMIRMVMFFCKCIQIIVKSSQFQGTILQQFRFAVLQMIFILSQVPMSSGLPASTDPVYQLRSASGSTPWQARHHNRYSWS